MADTGDPSDVLRADARENHQRILIAAREVFAAQGLGAKLADVASHAGVGVGTIYRRFESKERLIEELYVARLGDVAAMVGEAQAIADPWEGLLYFLRSSATMMANDRVMRELVFAGAPSIPQTAGASVELTEHITEAQAVISDTAEHLVRRAKESGALRADFEATDLPVLAFSIQATAQFAMSHNPDLWRRTMGMIIDGIRASRTSLTALESPALTRAQLSEIFVAHQTGKAL